MTGPSRQRAATTRPIEVSAPEDAPAVRVLRVRDGATLPTRQSTHAAGLDLCVWIEGRGSVTLAPGDIHVFDTGFIIAIPEGHEGQVRPRSGLASRHGVTLPNAPGTIDSDYRGEARVPLINLGRDPVTISHGMRVAQLVVAPVTMSRIVEVEKLDETSRGVDGFGSTGL